MNIVEVGYNIQSSVDAKHNLIVDYHTTNQNDYNALAPLAIESKEAFGLDESESLIVLADKGYYKGQQIQACHDQNIDTLVSPRKPNQPNKSPEVTKSKFKYDKKEDEYTCPKGATLNYQGTFARNKRGQIQNYFNRYVADHQTCQQCPLYKSCVNASSRKNNRGSYIDRSEYDGALERNNEQFKSRMTEYKKRQAIVEHPFGTIKRQWGYTYMLMKGIDKVDTEFSLICLVYNFKRVMTIMGKKSMKKALKRLDLAILQLSASVEGHITILYSSIIHSLMICK